MRPIRQHQLPTTIHSSTDRDADFKFADMITPLLSLAMTLPITDDISISGKSQVNSRLTVPIPLQTVPMAPEGWLWNCMEDALRSAIMDLWEKQTIREGKILFEKINLTRLLLAAWAVPLDPANAELAGVDLSEATVLLDEIPGESTTPILNGLRNVCTSLINIAALIGCADQAGNLNERLVERKLLLAMRADPSAVRPVRELCELALLILAAHAARNTVWTMEELYKSADPAIVQMLRVLISKLRMDTSSAQRLSTTSSLCEAKEVMTAVEQNAKAALESEAEVMKTLLTTWAAKTEDPQMKRALQSLAEVSWPQGRAVLALLAATGKCNTALVAQCNAEKVRELSERMTNLGIQTEELLMPGMCRHKMLSVLFNILRMADGFSRNVNLQNADPEAKPRNEWWESWVWVPEKLTSGQVAAHAVEELVNTLKMARSDAELTGESETTTTETDSITDGNNSDDVFCGR